MNATTAADEGQELAGRCLELLRARRHTVAAAESLTAGLVAATLGSVPGASDALRGGLVAYATDVKTAVLGVAPGVVARHGVVSQQCAEAMAVHARLLFGSTYAIATTGVAGPDRQEGKAVGTVYVAVAAETGTEARGLSLAGDRNEIRRSTVAEALRLMADVLIGMAARDGDSSR